VSRLQHQVPTRIVQSKTVDIYVAVPHALKQHLTSTSHHNPSVDIGDHTSAELTIDPATNDLEFCLVLLSKPHSSDR